VNSGSAPFGRLFSGSLRHTTATLDEVSAARSGGA